MLKTISKIFPLADFLYLLQLEGYETDRYFSLLNRFFWKRDLQKRDKLIWTKRVKIIASVAFIPSIILFPLTPLWIGLASLITNPYFENIKKNIQSKARNKFAEEGKNTRVIMIAGSYGKTTTKNYIYELIRFNYKTQMIPGNINTLTGIANWLVNNFDRSSEVLIAEVDPYYIGEIRQACEIIPPDITILTHIGDQHLERLGSKKNLRLALEEVFKYSKPNAIKIKNLNSNLEYALAVAKHLNIPKDFIKDTVKKLKTPNRRGDIKVINNFEVIDQSYNISEQTAKFNINEALKIAKKKGLAGSASKKLIIVTAGIPETGEENKDANKNLGKLLAKKADKIILLKSIFYKEILTKSDKFALADDLNEAWKKIEDFDPKKYIILMLPELNDLYYNS